MVSSPPPKLFDRARVARNRDRASSDYRQYAFLKGRESNQLLERLRDSPRKFEHALDLFAHDGQASEALIQSGLVAQVTAMDPSARMVQALRDNGMNARVYEDDNLPFEPGTFDLAVSVLSLHWVNDLPGLLAQIKSALKPDGLFLACLFGGGTLTELRTALIEAELEITGGISPRLSPLPGVQDMAGLLQGSGFALPVADRDRVTVRYAHPMQLLGDLKGMGEQAAFAKRPDQARQPLSRRILARMTDIYSERFSDPDGRVRASFEIIWLSGWAPAANQPKPLRPGSAKFSLADAVKHSKAMGKPEKS
ncbi:MAG: methyltransferase domain-containing protein [Pseudomonadota bacterium]